MWMASAPACAVLLPRDWPKARGDRRRRVSTRRPRIETEENARSETLGGDLVELRLEKLEHRLHTGLRFFCRPLRAVRCVFNLRHFAKDIVASLDQVEQRRIGPFAVLRFLDDAADPADDLIHLCSEGLGIAGQIIDIEFSRIGKAGWGHWSCHKAHEDETTSHDRDAARANVRHANLLSSRVVLAEPPIIIAGRLVKRGGAGLVIRTAGEPCSCWWSAAFLQDVQISNTRPISMTWSG